MTNDTTLAAVVQDTTADMADFRKKVAAGVMMIQAHAQIRGKLVYDPKKMAAYAVEYADALCAALGVK